MVTVTVPVDMIHVGWLVVALIGCKFWLTVIVAVAVAVPHPPEMITVISQDPDPIAVISPVAGLTVAIDGSLLLQTALPPPNSSVEVLNVNDSPMFKLVTPFNPVTEALGVILMVVVTAEAHSPDNGVKVYVVVCVLSIVGDQVPEIPFSEITGRIIVLPKHSFVERENDGIVNGFVWISHAHEVEFHVADWLQSRLDGGDG